MKALPPSREQRRHDAAVEGALSVAALLVIIAIGVPWLLAKLAGRAVPTSV
ncbi:hypothetical protein A2cp1_3758 [Anaeromyxobacter dehalogenans 2CP-1]|uniref:Uncharacterized protein n=1 Tax=Anaeromyxobacter dehalogenans (strain ATCC BAA-258 / DSM 21875 / 2CP-1) TaxID=455488 RepID=B8J6W2_ANAD2|nr:hypothetical protein [Anaeromyxobacter dehalogenans]ACL67084.1 hypothetical protein A2cp1_3758 [Anaeromyxobacter dehalogenans 2CP-1]